MCSIDDVTGKIHVEIERARLTMKLSKIKEADGDIAGAADVLHELQVETYGSMDRREKVEFILDQMRLSLAKKDYIRTGILAKKISTRFFDKEEYVKKKCVFGGFSPPSSSPPPPFPPSLFRLLYGISSWTVLRSLARFHFPKKPSSRGCTPHLCLLFLLYLSYS